MSQHELTERVARHQGDHPLRALEHREVGARLDLVVGGEPHLGVDTLGADERSADVDSGQRVLGPGASELVASWSGDTAGHHELQPRSERELGGDVQRVGDDSEISPVREQVGQLARQHAAGQSHHMVPAGYPRTRLDGNPPMVGQAGVVLPDRQVVRHVLGERTTMRPGEQASLLEQGKIAAQSRGRHVELGGQLVDVYGSGARESVQNRAEAVASPHGGTTRRFVRWVQHRLPGGCSVPAAAGAEQRRGRGVQERSGTDLGSP